MLTLGCPINRHSRVGRSLGGRCEALPVRTFGNMRLPCSLLRPRLDMRERTFYHCSMLTDHSLRVIIDDVGMCQRISGDPGCCSESWNSAPSASRPANRAPFRKLDGTEKSGTKWHIYRREIWERPRLFTLNQRKTYLHRGLRYASRVTIELPRVPLWRPNPTKQRSAYPINGSPYPRNCVV